MHAALLRAEFFTKQGRMDEAKDVLQDALAILDSPTVKTLRNKIEKKIGEIAVS